MAEGVVPGLTRLSPCRPTSEEPEIALGFLQAIKLGPGYQLAYAQRVKAEVGLPTIAVGLITEPEQAEAIMAVNRRRVNARCSLKLLWAVSNAKHHPGGHETMESAICTLALESPHRQVARVDVFAGLNDLPGESDSLSVK